MATKATERERRGGVDVRGGGAAEGRQVVVLADEVVQEVVQVLQSGAGPSRLSVEDEEEGREQERASSGGSASRRGSAGPSRRGGRGPSPRRSGRGGLVVTYRDRCPPTRLAGPNPTCGARTMPEPAAERRPVTSMIIVRRGDVADLADPAGSPLQMRLLLVDERDQAGYQRLEEAWTTP